MSFGKLNLEEIERFFDEESRMKYMDESEAVYDKKHRDLTPKERYNRYEVSHQPKWFITALSCEITSNNISRKTYGTCRTYQVITR